MPVAYRKPVSISLPPPLLKEVERLAKRRHQTTSEFVRAALRRYIDQEQAWRETLAYGRKKAKEQGIRGEEDIYRIMDEIRHGRPSLPYASASGRR
jgi:predicted transcriptional regulator